MFTTHQTVRGEQECNFSFLGGMCFREYLWMGRRRGLGRYSVRFVGYEWQLHLRWNETCFVLPKSRARIIADFLFVKCQEKVKDHTQSTEKSTLK